MNAKQILLALGALEFAALNVWAVASSGLSSLLSDIWTAATATPMSYVLAADLLIALSLSCAWMVAEGRRRGVAPWGYVLVTALTGSLGTLLFLIRRESALPRGGQA